MPALGWGTNEPPALSLEALLSFSPRFKRFQNPAVTLELSLHERNLPSSFAVAGKVIKSRPGLRSTVLTPNRHLETSHLLTGLLYTLHKTEKNRQCWASSAEEEKIRLLYNILCFTGEAGEPENSLCRER